MAIRKKAKQHTVKAKKSSAKPLTSKAAGSGEWFEKLVKVQARLRAADGCPWDREQTHATLRTYLIEEAYEVLDALESGDDSKFAEELGDLLLQIVFHSQIAREEQRFDVRDVIREIHDKMVRRHPHVFGETKAKNSAEVLKKWEQIKAEERRAKGGEASAASGTKEAESLLDGISRALPATIEGFQLTRRAARIGFDWANAEGMLEKIAEESSELREALNARETGPRIEEEIGDLLFAAVNVARFLHVDPEIALKKANGKFSRRFRAMERRARESGRALADVPRAEMEALWEAVKDSGDAHGEQGVGGPDDEHDERRVVSVGETGGVKPPLQRVRRANPPVHRAGSR
jgi:tetrapyrrole methylase family protein/MazG family protein